jgi:hypothetical protein
MSKALPLLGMVLMAGCAAPMASYVEPITSEDTKVISAGIGSFVSDRQTPNAGPIVLESPEGDALMAPEIKSALEAAGYKVVGSGGKHRLRYQVMALDTGVLMRLSLDGGDAARFYQRQAGTLSPSGPFTFRDFSQ